MTFYSIERYRPEHKQQLARLQKQLWGSTPARNRKYLEWKYELNPYTPDPLIYVATHKEKVIGMRGMYGAIWEVGPEGRQLPIPCAADSLLDRAHRGKGVFSRLTRFALDDLIERGYGHVLNLSASAANYVSSIMTQGWRPIGAVGMVQLGPRMPGFTAGASSRILQNDVATRLLRLGRRFRTAIRDNGFGQFDRLAARNRGDGHLPTLALQSRPSAMADLVARIGNGHSIRHHRDSRYFEWKLRNPDANYRYVFWDQAGRLEGYLVLGNLIGQSRVYIADWEATDPEILAGLLEAAVAGSSSRQNLQVWSATLSTERTQLLDRAGFETAPIISRYSGRLLIKSLNRPDDAADLSSTRDFEDLQNWDLRMIYSDAL